MPPQAMDPVINKINIYKIFFLHLFVTATYLSAMRLIEQLEKHPDIIATGLRQWACILLHIVITTIVCIGGKHPNRSKLMLINLCAISCWVTTAIIVEVYWF
ncbi:hypothetical protein BH09BAC2_BH09BAC2_20450 [soil metagenome]